ncbi:MAG: family 78 glycoside hydrolase catalytic domain, partial [Melioribacteraceae bacterium]|nr:family 78 glycoside hydrolase catalytic domain [Melioribacteraceae bacterium]
MYYNLGKFFNLRGLSYLPLIGIIAISSYSFCPVEKAAFTSDTILVSAKWIGTPQETILNDSLLYGDYPAPIFRKEFIINQEINTAVLYITAAGYYNALLNGKKIGRNYFDPAWTDFSKRIYYSEYDLSTEIKEGSNILGVTLGNGFYNPLPMRMWGHLNLRNYLTVGQPIFIAKLRVEYKNGEVEEIVTDDSWEYFFGPIIRNNVYLGEVYDARREIKNWSLPGFNSIGWGKSHIHKGPGGKLQKSFFPPIQITNIIEPVSISAIPNNRYVVDMGENFTGTYRIKLNGRLGDTISLRFGERIYQNGELNPMTTVAGQIKEPGKGGPGSPAIAWQEDKYIFGDSSDIWYSPLFTFHTYRYMEISGIKRQVNVNDLKGIALNTNVNDNGTFNCSTELVNSIQGAVEKTFVANLIGVQSDCPAREKFGYGGDLNAVSEAF